MTTCFEPQTRKGDWIQARSGIRFYPMDPRPEDLNIRDIAKALSQQCRFAGHTSTFYSVAQHSTYVSLACDPEDALWGLLHDASEAYLVDLPRPVKHLPELAPYREAEERLMEVICDRFKLPREMPESVRVADEKFLAAEARQLMAPLDPGWSKWLDGIPAWKYGIHPLKPRHAELAFLVRFADLTGDIVPEELYDDLGRD